MLLTASSTPTTIKMEDTFAFPWQQWLLERAQCTVVPILCILFTIYATSAALNTIHIIGMYV
jgi:hypothetical protein